ncbi:MAG TPA: putative quinol monooxygenase [Terracidiphilus sp.]|nr:putative quinol monooxygenase [Terracidiphilus sp.]
MISFCIHMTFSSDDRDEVTDILRKLTEASRQEPGCVSYIPHRVEGDPDRIIIYEQYKDAAAEAAHRNSEHFKQYAVGGLYQKMLDRRRDDLDALA